MPCFTVPVDDPLHESNACHAPSGSAAGGQFCKGDGATLPPGYALAPPNEKPYQGQVYSQVLKHHGEMVGAITLVKHRTADGSAPEYLDVGHANVYEDYQGKGFGSVLYRAALAWAKSHGYKGIQSTRGVNRSPDADDFWKKQAARGRATLDARGTGTMERRRP